MYPMPIAKWTPARRALYKMSLPLALLVWLLPMLAVLVTSVRSSEELVQGNYWGWPEDFSMLANYREALTSSPMLHYFWNSCLITIPSVIGAIALAALRQAQGPEIIVPHKREYKDGEGRQRGPDQRQDHARGK